VIRQDGRIVAEHPRSFGRGETVYDPWHYVPVLARKPGALRNGAPFKDWVLPAAMERVRRKLAGVDDGNRQMVDILTAVLTDGLPAVEAACTEATVRLQQIRSDRVKFMTPFYPFYVVLKPNNVVSNSSRKLAQSQFRWSGLPSPSRSTPNDMEIKLVSFLLLRRLLTLVLRLNHVALIRNPLDNCVFVFLL
jgi:hypothetical protein